MGITYEDFLNQDICLESYGIFPWGKEDVPYFCTPEDAVFLGRTGVDGIHYCFVKGYGETVFVVSPCNAPGEYVHPVARDFEDFLRLLMVCKGEAALEQSWMWSQEKFDRFVAEQPVTPEQEQTKMLLETKLHISPEPAPYQYLQQVRAEVDCSRWNGTEMDCQPAETAQEAWEVQFENQGEPGQEVHLDTAFSRGGRDFRIPAMYLCEKGLVIDFCMKVPAQEEQDFIDRWSLSSENDNVECFSPAEWEQMEWENPMSFKYALIASVNGIEIPDYNMTGDSWNACLPESEREQAVWMEHYNLDRNACWVFRRYALPWGTEEKLEIRELWLELKPRTMNRSGTTFTVEKPGDTVQLTHPTTGETYLLKVLEYGPYVVEDGVSAEGWEIPRQLWSMKYTLSPELSDEVFSIEDSTRCDEPCRVTVEENPGNASVGIIGGADGPMAFIFSPQKDGAARIAYSSPHFERVEKVEWKPVFQVQPVEDIRIRLV